MYSPDVPEFKSQHQDFVSGHNVCIIYNAYPGNI